MTLRLMTLRLLILSFLLSSFAGLYAGQVSPTAQSDTQQKLTQVQQKVENFSERKKARFERRAKRLQERLAQKPTQEDGTQSESLVRVGLVILIVGGALALVRVATGIAGLLLNIGLVVLVVGLALWLIGLIL